MTRSLFVIAAALIGAPSFAAPQTDAGSVWGAAKPLEKIAAEPCRLNVLTQVNGQALWVELDKGQMSCITHFEAISTFAHWQAQPTADRAIAPVSLVWNDATALADFE